MGLFTLEPLANLELLANLAPLELLALATLAPAPLAPSTCRARAYLTPTRPYIHPPPTSIYHRYLPLYFTTTRPCAHPLPRDPHHSNPHTPRFLTQSRRVKENDRAGNSLPAAPIGFLEREEGADACDPAVHFELGEFFAIFFERDIAATTIIDVGIESEVIREHIGRLQT